jgi:hypothetical protein
LHAAICLFFADLLRDLIADCNQALQNPAGDLAQSRNERRDPRQEIQYRLCLRPNGTKILWHGLGASRSPHRQYRSSNLVRRRSFIYRHD